MAIIPPVITIILYFQKFRYHMGITNYISESASHNVVKSSTFAISANILE